MGRASAVIVWLLLLPTIIAASEPERLLNVRDMYPSDFRTWPFPTDAGLPLTLDRSHRTHTDSMRQSREISKSGENAIGMTYRLLICA